MTASAAASGTSLRIGTGFDVHAFDPAVPLRLAGLEWPDEPGLSGHSDGDAVCHAVVDALLSAAGQGDIGELIDAHDPATETADSTQFVTRAVERIGAAGWRVVHVAVQVVAARPRIAPRRGEAEALLSRLVSAPVSLVATKSDGLGFTGRGEGIAAMATALLEQI